MIVAVADQRGSGAKRARTGAQEGSRKANTPPGRTNRESERKAATGSGSHIRMKRPTAASKGSPSGIWDTSVWVKLTLRRPASATRPLAPGDRARVALDSHHLPGRAHQPGR